MLSENYISPSDGLDWGNLHDMHRVDILSEDCQVCHNAFEFLPVHTNESSGGNGLEPISCLGCHGRAEDDNPGNPDFTAGIGSGLRQHHVNAGTTLCANCHSDANPANYTPVGEEILPPYYANPGSNHPNMPNESCNGDGSENFRGLPEGLDNDGDEFYDLADTDCSQPEGCWLNCPLGDGGLITLAGDGNKSPDLNFDGAVTVADFGLFAVNFNGIDYCSDFNCDGAVNIGDFAIFGTHFNHGPGPVGVCE
jgi:hypothetical protein